MSEQVRTKSFAEQVYSRTLSNGIPVYVWPRPGIGTVLVQIAVRTGGSNEGEFLGCGLSHFLEHMLFNGTENFPGESDISDTLTKLGGETNAYTSNDSTVYYIDIGKEYAHNAIDMLTDMVARPLFPAERFKKEKDIILREEAMGKDNVSRFVRKELMEELYHFAPIRVPVIGIAEKIAQVDRELMMRYYEMRYAPCRTGIAIVGDVDPVEIADYAETKIGSWRAGRMDEPVLFPEPPQNYKRERTVYFDDPMARLHLCWRMNPLDHKENAVAMVLMQLFGNMESSRLVRKYVQQEKLADDIGFQPVAFTAETEVIGISAVCKHENVETLKKDILKEIERLRTENIPDAEFTKVKKMVRREKYASMVDKFGVGSILVRCFLRKKDIGEYDTLEDELNAVTPDDVRAFAERYLIEEHMTVLQQLPKSCEKPQALNNDALNIIAKPEVKTLSGGQRYIVMPDCTIDTVNLSIFLPGGKNYETEDEISYSFLLKNVISCGTEDYTEEELDDFADCNAINMSFRNSPTSFSGHADCLSEDVDKMVEVLISILTKPLLSQECIERERAILYHAVQRQLSHPQSLSEDIADQELYCDNPAFFVSYERMVSSLDKVDPDKLRAYLKKLFVSGQTVISIGGAISVEKGEAVIRRIVDAIEWSDKPLKCAKLTNYVDKPVTRQASLPGKQQAVVRRDFILPMDIVAEHFVEFKLVNAINSGMSNRVFQEIREKRGLAYYALLTLRRSTQVLRATYLSGTKPGAEAEVIKLFEQNQQEIAANGYTREEFENAMRQVRLDFARCLERPWEMAEFCATFEHMHKGDADNYWKCLDRLDQMDYETFNAIVKQWFSAPNAVTVIVLPESVQKDQ